ncbi:MAG: hypothetical protein IT382_21380, partial [Deltaproteobacteria bacterium]|nr:hypothetical protein [Deltaproteobacteria bacterium]
MLRADLKSRLEALTLHERQQLAHRWRNEALECLRCLLDATQSEQLRGHEAQGNADIAERLQGIRAAMWQADWRHLSDGELATAKLAAKGVAYLAAILAPATAARTEVMIARSMAAAVVDVIGLREAQTVGVRDLVTEGVVIDAAWRRLEEEARQVEQRRAS